MLDTSNQMFFEDIPVGYTGSGLSRTIDFADIILYANFTRDYNPIHTDKESAKKSLIGQVIGHGMISVMISSGMMLRTEFGSRTVHTLLECLGHNEIKFVKPTLVGDTLTTTFEVVEKKEFDENKGIVEMKFSTTNQRGELVTVHGRTYLFAKKKYNLEAIAVRGAW